MCTYTLVYRLRFFFSRVYLIFCISGGIWQHRKKMLRILQYRNVIERTNTNSINRRKKKQQQMWSHTFNNNSNNSNREKPHTPNNFFLFSFDTLYFHPFQTVRIAIGGYSKLIWLFTFHTFACLMFGFFCSLLPSSEYNINKDAIFPINNHKWRWILLN